MLQLIEELEILNNIWKFCSTIMTLVYNLNLNLECLAHVYQNLDPSKHISMKLTVPIGSGDRGDLTVILKRF